MAIITPEDLHMLRPEVSITIIASALLDNPRLREMFIEKLADAEEHAFNMEEAGADEVSWDELIVTTCFGILSHYGMPRAS